MPYASEYGNNFDAVGWGKVCVCASVLNFFRSPPSGDTAKYRNPENGKIWNDWMEMIFGM